MTEQSFDKLVKLLRRDISIDLMQSMRSSSGNQPITPDMVVAAGLRFLGGSPYKDVADVLGISRESAKHVVGKFLDAVNNS